MGVICMQTRYVVTCIFVFGGDLGTQFWVWTQLNPSDQTPEKTVRFVFQILNSIIALRKSQYEWIKGKTTRREEMHSIF